MFRNFLTMFTIALLSCLSITAYAQGGFRSGIPADGGFEGPSSSAAIITIEQARAGNDGDPVILRGHIVEYIHKDDYLFKDDTGTIRVEIEHDKWAGQIVIPQNLVEIWGEIEKDWDSVQIDVNRIRVIEQSAP